MLKKQSVIRYLSLLGIMGMLTMGTGCAELKRLRTENQQLNDRLIALQKENADLSVMASRYENELKRLEDSRRALQAKLEGTGATTKVKDGLLSIMLPGSVLFDPGQAKLRPQSKETLNKIAKIIKSDIPNQVVRIEGHTDNIGTEAYNLDLSRRRARSVRR